MMCDIGVFQGPTTVWQNTWIWRITPLTRVMWSSPPTLTTTRTLQTPGWLCVRLVLISIFLCSRYSALWSGLLFYALNCHQWHDSTVSAIYHSIIVIDIYKNWPFTVLYLTFDCSTFYCNDSTYIICSNSTSAFTSCIMILKYVLRPCCSC